MNYSGAGDGPAAKKPKVEADLMGGMANLVKAKVTEVSTDFTYCLSVYRMEFNQTRSSTYEEAYPGLGNCTPIAASHDVKTLPYGRNCSCSSIVYWKLE